MERKGFTAILGVIALVGVALVYVVEGVVSPPQLAALRSEPAEREQVFGWSDDDAAEQEDEPAADSDEPTDEATPQPAREPLPEEEPAEPAIDPVDDYGVTASHPLAVQVGMEVLEAGGNAVDAAVAVSYTLSVVEPFGSGVGGGGTMLVHPLEGDPVAYNYRETAPLDGEYGFLGAGVPGFVLGLETVHEAHGTIPLPELIRPAARLAEEGVAVSDFLTERLDRAQYRMPVDAIPHFYPNGTPVAPGTTLEQPALAETLEAIADEGSQAFYSGEIAERIAEAIEGVDVDDLGAYEVEITEPVSGAVGDGEVLSAPPPMTGITLVQILQMAEAAGLHEHGDTPEEYAPLLAGILRAAEEDRSELVGDPLLVDVPVDELTDPDHARAQIEDLDAVAPPPSAGPDEGEARTDGVRVAQVTSPDVPEKSDTTHLVVVDPDGTMVSATNTLSNFFGSGQYVAGFFMNDQLTNFNEDDAASPNLPEPGKRPRSFITPTIVVDDGRPVLGIGSPGGNRIPAILSQVLERFILRGEPLDDAVAAPRLIVDGDHVIAEDGFPSAGVSALGDLGYRTERRPSTQFFGGVQALAVDYDAGRLAGSADERRDGTFDTAQS